MTDQMPLAVESPKCAAQPSFEVSVTFYGRVEGGATAGPKEHCSRLATNLGVAGESGAME